MLNNIEKKEVLLWHRGYLMDCMRIGLIVYKSKADESILELVKWFGTQSKLLNEDFKYYE